nr:PAS domain S-box protein [Fischerella sp. PCC 9605]
MAVWTLWYPTYWLSGSIKAITAIVSVYTALVLVELVPTALQIPSTAQLEAANQKLQQEITARQQAEAALRKAHDELEIRVQERTAELLTANTALQAEIADRQRAEAALRDTTTLQRAILDSANYTIISTTEDGIILTFNAAAERCLGYSAQEVVGKTTPVLIHDSDEVVKAAQELSQELGVTIKPGFEAFVARARRGQVDEREWSYIRKDGSHFPVLLSVTALRDAENNITGFLGIGSDITDRKRAEEALRQSEATLRSFFDSAPMMMGVVEVVDDDILHISDNVATGKLFRRTPEAMQNQLASEMGLPQKYISLWIEHYHQAEHTHSPVRFEYAHETSTGNRWLSATVAAISSDSSSSRPRFSYIVEDISDRKQSEQELRWKEALLRSMANASPLAFYVVDNRTDAILYFNHRFCEIWGLEHLEERMQRGELKNNDIIPDCLSVVADVPAFAESCKPLQSEENRGIIEDEIPFVDGRIVRRFSSQIRDEDDRYFGRLYLFEDITARKRAEEELRHLSKALESAVEGISQLDRQGRYLKVNPAYASMVGYQSEELIGMEWQLTVHPEDKEKLSSAYQQMLSNGKAEVEARAVRKDGSVFDKQVVMVKAYDQEQFIGHYCFMKDISDRREVERLKDEFISVVSHELRTPLTSISGALDLLASGILQNEPEDAQRMLNIAANNTDRLVRLINDILDIERIESGKVQMTKQTCDAADLMIQSAEVVEEIAEQAEVTLSVSPVSTRLWADPDRIIQVLTNLLSNAIKFSPIGSTVWLSAEIQERERGRGGEGEREGKSNFSLTYPTPPLPHSSTPPLLHSPTVLFTVRDQGRGIPADKLESIFERFGQVDASDSRQKGGTGLGLAICRSILQHHGGQIWAESTLGEGSTFFFTLPILSEEEGERGREGEGGNEQFKIQNSKFKITPPLSHSSTPPLPPLILECDDDPSVRVVVQATLERQGYRVLTVASGQEAVEQATANQPDAIILNLRMPGMDGWETLAILKQQPQTQNIPVIILSGLLPDTIQSLPEGVSDWIIKPPDFKLLCQALEKATAKQNQTIKVLIIEDDQDLAQVLIAMFNSHGIVTFYAQTGRKAIQVSQNVIPDLLVLDLGLPECDGFAVVDWLRQHNRLCQVPLVVYTARDLDESDRERLRLGQTLFLTKGRITPQEFEQRVINLLNRMIHGKSEES